MYNSIHQNIWLFFFKLEDIQEVKRDGSSRTNGKKGKDGKPIRKWENNTDEEEDKV